MRNLIPGGLEGVMSELAVTPLQIDMIADPSASTREAMAALQKPNHEVESRSNEQSAKTKPPISNSTAM